jgi:mitogen-activated protein kinase kinase
MAGRRLKPNFTLKDIDASILPPPITSGGALGAGLGAGRPSLGAEPPKRPPAGNFGSPFSNFSKIV